MNFTERVKKIRADYGLTQISIAESLGMSRDSYINFEYNRIKNPNAMNPKIKAVCEKYHINEKWLRTGEGEMYIERSRETEINDLVSLIISSDYYDYRLQLTRILYQVSDEHMEALYNMAKLWIEGVSEKNK